MSYTTVFPLHSKGEVPDVLIPWIRAVCLQLRERFRQDLPILRLHFERGGEFSFDPLQDFCRGEGILQSFTLPASPQQIGIVERSIGLVMEVAHTSMIHAAAPHFLWSFAVQYAVHQLNLWRRVSLPKTSPTLRWTGKVGDASVFRVWGCRAFVRDTSGDKLSSHAFPSVFLGFPPDAPGWHFYHPTSHCVLPSQDVTFDESVPFYHPLPGTVPAEVAVDSGATRGAASGGAASGGAEPASAEAGGAEAEGAEPGGAESASAESGGAEHGGAEPWDAESGGAEPEGAEPGAAGAGGSTARGTGAGDAGAISLGGAGVTAGAAGPEGSRTRGTAVAGAGGVGGVRGPLEALELETLALEALDVEELELETLALEALELEVLEVSTLELETLELELLALGAGAGGTGAGGAGAGGPGTRGAGAGGAGAGDPGAGGTGTGVAGAGGPGAGGTVQRRPFFVPPLPLSLPPPDSVLRQVPSLPSSTGLLVGQPARGDMATLPTWLHWVVSCRMTLAALGFAPSTADPSLFLRTDTSLPPFYVLVYVNDLVFATADIAALALVKSELQKRHTCTDLGELCSYLGLQITWDKAQRTITLTQLNMVHQVLQRFDFWYSLPQSTPLPTGHSLLAPPSDEPVEPSGPYPQLVGCLMYVMTCTRPDLAYPLSILPRYVPPGRHLPEHWEAAKRVLRYLCSTSGMGLVLGGRGPIFFTGHADASWVEDLATQRSSQGYTFSLGSGSVSRQSNRSSSVLCSSCEAEIYAGAMAAQELRWLTYLLTDLGERPRSPPVLYVDNKAMIALCPEHRTKYIALRYFLARELQ
ncbi:unnamed protein product [Closterium sp. NIES-53]